MENVGFTEKHKKVKEEKTSQSLGRPVMYLGQSRISKCAPLLL